MESKAIFQTIYVDHPDEHNQKRAVTLEQGDNEIHLCRGAIEELTEQL